MKNKISGLYMSAPCKDCPFRSDSLKGWLGKDRAIEIVETDSFVCHKNTDRQCAGHMISNKSSNMFYRLSKAYDIDLGLSNSKLVLSPEEFIFHHE